MKTKLSTMVELLRTSYWFVPALMSLGAVLVAVLMLEADRRYKPEWIEGSWWLYGGDHQGARAVLATVVGSMMSVTSVVFSITIVTLTLAAGQYGSRILRQFIRDRGNQITLGTFIATFVYAMLILRTIRGVDDRQFIPALSVSVAILFTFASVGVLIYFIHHVASGIQADSVIHAISNELRSATDRLYPQAIGSGPPADITVGGALLPPMFAERAVAVRAVRDDYLQGVEQDTLFEAACKHDLILKLHHRPGDFVLAESVLADVWFASGKDPSVVAKIRKAFVQGSTRTMHQDAEFGVLQLVEVAVRALSPGINDPFTAITCVDRLSAALSRLAGRTFPAPVRFDTDGRLRVVADTTSFTGFTDAAFNQIRQNAGKTPAVLIRLLEAIAAIAQQVRTEEQREALRTHAEMVLQAGLDTVTAERDRAALRQRYAAAMSALQPGSA